jgi:hypothetical protein
MNRWLWMWMWMKICFMADTEKDDLCHCRDSVRRNSRWLLPSFCAHDKISQKSFSELVALCGCGKNFTDLLFLLP